MKNVFKTLRNVAAIALILFATSCTFNPKGQTYYFNQYLVEDSSGATVASITANSLTELKVTPDGSSLGITIEKQSDGSYKVTDHDNGATATTLTAEQAKSSEYAAYIDFLSLTMSFGGSDVQITSANTGTSTGTYTSDDDTITVKTTSKAISKDGSSKTINFAVQWDGDVLHSSDSITKNGASYTEHWNFVTSF